MFHADAKCLDSQNWSQVRPMEPEDTIPDDATYPTRFEGRTFDAARTSVLMAPDNVDGELQDFLGNAETSIQVQQVSIECEGVLVEETRAAAGRGVTVRIFVSGAWFVESEKPGTRSGPSNDCRTEGSTT